MCLSSLAPEVHGAASTGLRLARAAEHPQTLLFEPARKQRIVVCLGDLASPRAPPRTAPSTRSINFREKSQVGHRIFLFHSVVNVHLRARPKGEKQFEPRMGSRVRVASSMNVQCIPGRHPQGEGSPDALNAMDGGEGREGAGRERDKDRSTCRVNEQAEEVGWCTFSTMSSCDPRGVRGVRDAGGAGDMSAPTRDTSGDMVHKVNISTSSSWSLRAHPPSPSAASVASS